MKNNDLEMLIDKEDTLSTSDKNNTKKNTHRSMKSSNRGSKKVLGKFKRSSRKRLTLKLIKMNEKLPEGEKRSKTQIILDRKKQSKALIKAFYDQCPVGPEIISKRLIEYYKNLDILH